MVAWQGMALSNYCAEKDRLLTDYNQRVNEWSKAVNSLNDHAGSTYFPLMMAVVDEARAEALHVKAEYAAHIAEHGC
jgi:hypothetical protein